MPHLGIVWGALGQAGHAVNSWENRLLQFFLHSFLVSVPSWSSLSAFPLGKVTIQPVASKPHTCIPTVSWSLYQ